MSTVPDYKRDTIATYDRYSEKFDQKFGAQFEQHVRENADQFLAHLSGNDIIDLGCGSGNHAAYFQEQGCTVTCIDLSEEMVKCCERKGLRAVRMDIEELMLDPGSVHGIWAYASLLHVPKSRVSRIIDVMAHALVSGGMLGLALKKGDGEQFETNASYPESQRYFVYYQDEEVRQLFSPFFDITWFQENDVQGRYTFMSYLMRRKELLP